MKKDIEYTLSKPTLVFGVSLTSFDLMAVVSVFGVSNLFFPIYLALFSGFLTAVFLFFANQKKRFFIESLILGWMMPTRLSAEKIAERFHTQGVYDDFHIRKDGAISVMWKLEALNLLQLTEDGFEAKNERLFRFFQSCPEKTEIQFIYDRYKRDNIDASIPFYNNRSKDTKFLSNKRRLTVLEPYMHTDIYLTVTFSHLIEDFKPSKFNEIFFFSPNKSAKLLQNKFEQDITLINQITENIEQEISFLKPIRLDSKSIIQLLESYYNFESDSKKNIKVSEEIFNNSLLYKDIAWDKSAVYIGQEKLLSVSLIELPLKIISPLKEGRYLSSPLGKFFNLNFDSRIVLSFYRLSEKEATKSLKKIKNANNSLTGLSEVADQKVAEVKSIRADFDLGKESLCNFGMNIFTLNSDENVLRQRRHDILNRFEKFESSRGIVENEDSLPIFLSCAPGNTIPYRSVLLRLSNAAEFINFCGHYGGMKTGITFIEPNTKKLVLYDLFSKEHNDNYNGLIVGPSGTGKTFTSSNMICKYYEQGVPVVIINIGPEYEPLVDALGGKNVRINEETPSYLDPFFYFSPSQKSKAAYNRSLECLYTFIELMVLKTDVEQRELQKDQEAIFRRSLRGFVENGGGLIYDFYDYIKKDEHFFNKDGHYRNYVLKVFDLYLEESMSEYFHPSNPHKLNLDITSKNLSILAFNLKGIEKQKRLLPLVSFLINQIVSSRMHFDFNRFLFVQDEAWKLFSLSKSMIEFLNEFFRTSRTTNSSSIFITQNILDVKEELVEAILTNSDTKFLLKHKSGDIDKTVNVLGLSKAEKSVLKQLAEHELFLSHFSEPIVLGQYFSDYDHELMSTDSADRDRRAKALEENHHNLIWALEDLTKKDKE